jgi:hypothetical protein
MLRKAFVQAAKPPQTDEMMYKKPKRRRPPYQGFLREFVPGPRPLLK